MDQTTLTFPPLLNGHEFHETKPLTASDTYLISDSPVQETELVTDTLNKLKEKKLGAGDLVWSTSLDVAHCAIVLEPEISAEKTLTMVPLGMVAIADCLGAICPPNLGITFGWPGLIYANGARIGNVSLYFPDNTPFDEIPDYAVLSMALNVKWPEENSSQEENEPGNDLRKTVLYEEGCGDIDAKQIINSWSRHFLTWIDTWQQEGFEPVHENWLFRAANRNQLTTIEGKEQSFRGQFIGLDEVGGALLKSDDQKIHLITLKEIWQKAKKANSG